MWREDLMAAVFVDYLPQSLQNLALLTLFFLLVWDNIQLWLFFLDLFCVLILLYIHIHDFLLNYISKLELFPGMPTRDLHIDVPKKHLTTDTL